MPLKVGNRLGNRKTTTGCITCKIRRVKCDEGKPSCKRCTGTGRRCDGYRDLGFTYTQSCQWVVPVVERSTFYLSGSGLNHVESYALQFFVEQATVQIAGWRGVGFWCSLVPQLSQNYSAVRHAAIALGSLLLRLRGNSPISHTTTNDTIKPTGTEAFALEHYSKAIKATLSTIKNIDDEEILASVTCILFVCIEALQGREEQAKSILRSKRARSVDFEKIYRTSASQRTEICAMFNRFMIQFMMFRPGTDQMPDIQNAALSIPLPAPSQPFQSLVHAEDDLFDLLSAVNSIVVVGESWKWRQMDEEAELRLSALRKRQRIVWHALNHWYGRFQELVARDASSLAYSTQLKMGASMISQQYNIMKICLAGNLEVKECFYDQFMQEFKTIVNEATLCAELLAKSENDTVFRFDTGWIPPLYWTALKCRHPGLRRQAVSLLGYGPRQEALWNTHVVRKIALRVIELEEAEVDSTLDPKSITDDTVTLPPEEKRIKAVIINPRTILNGREGKVTEFHSLPNGYGGGWHVRREFFTV